jgi:hypothetical protein
MVDVLLDSPKAEMSSASFWVFVLLTSGCASHGELSVASVQVGEGSAPEVVEAEDPEEL